MKHGDVTTQHSTYLGALRDLYRRSKDEDKKIIEQVGKDELIGNFIVQLEV